jgi:hypothetical protein
MRKTYLSALLTFIIFFVPFLMHLGATTAYAGCETAAYCDAPAGSCSQTCNGGEECRIGGWNTVSWRGCGDCNRNDSCSLNQSCTISGDPYPKTCLYCEDYQCVNEVTWDWCCSPGQPSPTPGGSPLPSPSPSPIDPTSPPTAPPTSAPTPSPGVTPSPVASPPPPATPTNLSCISPSSTSINLNWSSASGATNYVLYRCAGATCTPTIALSSTGLTTYNDAPVTAGTTYRYRVAATNSGGSSGYSSVVTCSPCVTGDWESFSCGAPFCDVDERVESRTSSGSCAPSVELERCIQDDLCLAESWFQVQGGNTYADRTDSPAIRSIISASDCTEPACIPNLITMMQELLNVDTDGVIISGGGSVETAGHYTPRDLVAQNTRLTRFKEGYDFFYRRSDLGSSPTDTFATQHDGALKPPLDGFHYSSQDLVIQDPWTVSAGESHVVFVDGNLTIENPSDFATLIEVEEGGFLAFIARGNITFAANVGHTNIATVTPNVEGVFIADNQIIVRTNDDPAVGDRRFVGAGSFVGWTGVDLQRDFADFGAGGSGATFNLTIPTETFIYRPDLVLSTPDFMLSPRSIWQETN